MEGEFTLEGEGTDPHRLTPGDAFVTPPGMRTKWADPTDDIEILEVSLPGTFSDRHWLTFARIGRAGAWLQSCIGGDI